MGSKRLATLLIILFGVFYLTRAGKIPAPIPQKDNRIAQEVQTPPPKIIGRPATMKIPKINVETVVEEVGMEESGRMGVPSSAYTVGWWKLGVAPGQNGSAVIAGHLDTPEGKPGIFYELDSLVPGDTIMINDHLGNEYKFIVKRTTTYQDATFPIESVFMRTDDSYLNLITCAGTWNSSDQNYQDRFVVFTKLDDR